MADNARSSFAGRPATRIGWWAFGLAVAFITMFIVNQSVFMGLPEEISWRETVLPYYGILMMLSGLVSGVLGLIAVIRRQERSWMVWLAIPPGAFALFFILGEFLFPH